MKTTCSFLSLLLLVGFTSAQVLPFSSSQNSFLPSSSSIYKKQTSEEFHLSEYHFSWDYDTQTWSDTKIYQYVRNSSGAVIQSTEQVHNQFTNFEYTTRVNNQYDSFGNLQSETLEDWYSNGWHNGYGHYWLYNQSGMDTMRFLLSWINSQWDTTNGYHKIFQFDTNNQITDEAYYTWNSDSSDFFPSIRFSHYYGQTTEKDSMITYFGTGNSWQKIEKMIYLSWYDYQENQPAHTIKQVYNGNLTATNDYQSFFSYGINGNYETFFDDWNINQWDTEFAKQVVNFDSLGNLTLDETYFKNNGSFELNTGRIYQYQYTQNGALTESIQKSFFSIDTNGYQNSIKIVYLDFVTESPEPVVSTDWVRLYPQPSAGWTNLAIRHAESGPVDLKIYDLQGKLVYADRLRHPGGQFEWALPTDWTPGMYLLRLDLRGKSVTKKLILD